MYRNTVVVKLFSIVLASAFLIESLPMFNPMSSMLTMGMDQKMISEMAVSQINVASGNVNGSSSGSCCDAIGTFSLSCDFVVSRSGSVVEYGVSKQVLDSLPIIQSTYIEAVSPPPKA